MSSLERDRGHQPGKRANEDDRRSAAASHQAGREGERRPSRSSEQVEGAGPEPRGEHPDEPAEGTPGENKRSRTWTKDPHGEHPTEPAEGCSDVS